MQERLIDNQGIALWTSTQGQGIPILLSSGGPGYPDYLAPVAAMIADLATTIRWEQRGCGRTHAEPPYTLADCLNDMEAIRQDSGVDRWIVGGHSWGADLALLYALRYPQRVQGLICMAGGRIHMDQAWLEAFRARKAAEGEELPVPDYPVNDTVYHQVIRDWQRALQYPTLLRDIAQLDIPVLFLYGDQDVRPGWPEEQVATLLPKGRFVLIPGAPHMLWFTQPDEVARHLRSFVRMLL